MPTDPLRCFPQWFLLICIASASPLHGQSEDRIWGRVFTEGGEQYEGFLRFGGGTNGASWMDLFYGSQDVGADPRQTWIDASRGGNPFTRTIELKGYLISWNDRSDDFPRQRGIAVRFGSLQGISVHNDSTELVLRPGVPGGGAAGTGPDDPGLWSGNARTLIGETTGSWRETNIEVEDLERGVTTISGDDVSRVEFARAPAGQEAGSARLFGTVEDHSGRSFTGPIIWNDRSLLLSDTLDGSFEWPSGAIRFDHIRSIERRPGTSGTDRRGGARVTLAGGEVADLPVDVARGRDPVADLVILDPALGRVTIDWDDFKALRLHVAMEGRSRQAGSDAPETASHDGFHAEAPLRGTVLTHAGEEVEGRIRWDALEEWSWDVLYGSSEGVELGVRFANIESIEQIAFPDRPPNRPIQGISLRGRVRLTLLDGRSYEMTGINDLGSGNLGILVLPASPDGRADWRYLAWGDVREIGFDHSRPRIPGSQDREGSPPS